VLLNKKADIIILQSLLDVVLYPMKTHDHVLNKTTRKVNI